MVTMCFQRDSRKDQIIVWGFILGTAGLLGWVGVQRVLEARTAYKAGGLPFPLASSSSATERVTPVGGVAPSGGGGPREGLRRTATGLGAVLGGMVGRSSAPRRGDYGPVRDDVGHGTG